MQRSFSLAEMSSNGTAEYLDLPHLIFSGGALERPIKVVLRYGEIQRVCTGRISAALLPKEQSGLLENLKQPLVQRRTLGFLGEDGYAAFMSAADHMAIELGQQPVARITQPQVLSLPA